MRPKEAAARLLMSRSVVQEIRGFIGAMNEDEQTNLVALAWLGRTTGSG
jgi:hypothetical protein